MRRAKLSSDGALAYSRGDLQFLRRLTGRIEGTHAKDDAAFDVAQPAREPSKLARRYPQRAIFLRQILRELAQQPIQIDQFYERNLLCFHVVDSFEQDSSRGKWGGTLPGVVRPLLEWDMQHIDGKSTFDRSRSFAGR